MNNIYQKINNIKQEFLKSNVKKSGKNKNAGFEYFELVDFMPTLVELMNKYKVYSFISFTEKEATITLINVEKAEEKVIITSPVVDFKSYKYEKDTKGNYTGNVIEDLTNMNSIQKMGAIQTYIRRYLYLIAFDIVEPELFDNLSGEIKENKGENKVEDKATVSQLAYIDSLKLDKRAICQTYKINSITELTKDQAKIVISKKTGK